MWVKRLLQALKETHTAVKYGFVFPYLQLSPRSPAERALSPVHGWQCCPRAPFWGGLWGSLVLRGRERRRCGGAEQQEWRRKMKTHKRAISGLELDVLARCAVPRKAAQPEIDVLLPNDRAQNGNPRCLPLAPEHCSCRRRAWLCDTCSTAASPAPFLETGLWEQREESGMVCFWNVRPTCKGRESPLGCGAVAPGDGRRDHPAAAGAGCSSPYGWKLLAGPFLNQSASSALRNCVC